jgi:hypothetical protein
MGDEAGKVFYDDNLSRIQSAKNPVLRHTSRMQVKSTTPISMTLAGKAMLAEMWVFLQLR